MEILRRVRVLAHPQSSAGMSDEQLLALIQQNASESFELMKESNAILSELIFSRDAQTLSDEDISVLSGLAGKLFEHASSEDCGIAYKIHCLLLKAARARGDSSMTVRELYYCGLTMTYLNVSDNRQRYNTFGSKIRSYFKEAADHMARYEEFDKSTRDYIVRSMSSCKAALPCCVRRNVEEYFRATDRALDVINSEHYRRLDPDLPWERYKYDHALDEMALLRYLRENKSNGTEDAAAAQRVYRAAQYAYQNSRDFGGGSAQSWRTTCYYKGARYLVGEGTAADVVECALEHFETADDNDYSADGVLQHMLTLAQVLSYRSLLEPADAMRLAPRVEQIADRAMQYLENTPPSNDPRVMNAAIRELAMAGAEAETAADACRVRKVFLHLLASHKPTYIHSLMVALLTRELTAQLVKTAPEALLGVRGYATVEQVRAHAEEICALAYNCGLYHDVGKSLILMYVCINSRTLLDEEYECIQWHPYLGYQLLANMGRQADLGEAALYHHRFYNNAGGYPAGCKGCPKDIKPIVDVLCVADSLDAATDGIGRCYITAKPFDALVKDLRSQSGTRYSPYVTALFDDAEFREKFKNKMYSERKKVYVQVYRSACLRLPQQQARPQKLQLQAGHEQ